MDEPTHRIVNGMRVELTKDECISIKKDWEENMVKANEEQEKIRLEEQKNQQIRESMAKLLGVSVEDINKALF